MAGELVRLVIATVLPVYLKVMSLCNSACDIVKYAMGHKLENIIVKISSME